MNTPENNPNDTHQTTERKKRNRWKYPLRLSIVTLVLLLSVGGWYYTRYLPSTSLIEKFIIVNSALEHSLSNLQKDSDQGLQSLKRDVKRSGNTREGLENIKRAELLKKRTVEMLGDIDKIKQKLIKEGGKGLDPKTHTVKRPKAKLPVSRLMVGFIGQSNGEGYLLEKKLNAYSSWLNQEYKDLLAIPLPSLTKIKGVKEPQNFVHHNFWQKPVVLALAKLTQLQHQLLEDQFKVLFGLHSKTGKIDDIKFDKIYTGVSAETNVLASGDTYQATMVIAAYPSKLNPRMTVNGKPIEVKEGIGKVRFKTTYPLGKKTWKGTVTFKVGGRDTTFHIQKEYIVIPRID